MQDLHAAWDRYVSRIGAVTAVSIVAEARQRCRISGLALLTPRVQAVDSTRLEQAQERGRSLLAAADPFLQDAREALSGLPYLLALADSDGVVIRLLADPTLAERGVSMNLFEGASWREQEMGLNGIGTALASGRPVVLTGSERTAALGDGWISVGVPIAESAAAIAGALELAVPSEHADVGVWGWTLAMKRAVEGALAGVAERQSRAEAEAAYKRLAFLAETSRLLAETLTYEATPEIVARLAVPQIADWCVVDLVDENGSIRQVAVAHVNPAKIALVHEARRRYRLDLERPYGLVKVLRTGRSELYPEILDDWRVTAARDAEHLELIRELGARSSMTVPLVARGRTLGAMTFVSAESGRRLGAADLALAEALAQRAALAIDNAQLHRAAQDAISLRDDVLAAVSHDLQNPLAAIKGRAQLLIRQTTGPGPEAMDRIRAGLASIDATASKMAAQIGDIVDLASLQMGQPAALVRRPTDLVALVRGVAADHQVTTRRHRILVEAATPEIVGSWDTARLERVIGNLVANAIKYSPAGDTVTVRIACEAAEAVLRVTDEGIGVPEADLPHIFTRFHRAKNVAERVAGSGIGLWGARAIVEQHGGTIAVTSKEGVGSTFTVRLPLDPAPPDSTASL
ncbi:MAG: GAF domain-containing protein [Chloroflexi bacterium]|nr:GAF domain-containing protein [Chloroflexota bacterium]